MTGARSQQPVSRQFIAAPGEAEALLSGVRRGHGPTVTASPPAVRASRTCSARDTPPDAQTGNPVSARTR